MNITQKDQMEWRLSQAAEYIGARWSGKDIVFSPPIKIDSREIRPGDIFWALPGERTDGHAFIEEAIERGADALVINPQLAGESLQRVFLEKIPALLTKDTLAALKSLSLRRLEMLDLESTIAITGTVGKTTTREMTRAVAESLGGVHCARRSFNTWIGCALTVLEAPLDTRFLILEMGTNHPGEIREMASMFRPSYGIITEVGAGHLEGLKDESGVLEAKMELANCGSLKCLSYNSDNALLSRAVDDLPEGITRIPVGRSSSLYRIEETRFEFDKDGPSLFLVLATPSGKRKLKPRLFGEQNAYAVAFAMAAGDFLGVPEMDQSAALESFKPLPGRGGVHVSGKGVYYIDETYNANPLSMRQALVTLSGIRTEGKKWAVLGAMGELGDDTIKWHREMFPYFDSFDGVFLFGGSWGRSMPPKVPENLRAFDDITKLSEILLLTLSPGDVVLFKGSRSFRMERAMKCLEDTG
ncbi:MAG: UDP-N-acetylmuramoyl-tripeptide--D-alanyl-D-alanine ligase [Thermovirgaceae bacterium]|nr:UDP-N-acetylmuramoyl-tripeptide--D-alanyl-D-alanine ligase [Thermovirgaceae bacterium]